MLLPVLIISLFTSCITPSYYQVYKATPMGEVVKNDNFLLYEDENCIVSYNLWSDGGNIGFKVFNKTDSNMYLNLDESFFVLNGIAYNYFKNRVFTHSVGSGTASTRSASASGSVSGTNIFGLPQTNRIGTGSSVGVVLSSEYSVAFHEEKTIVIPPKTSKIITEYSINQTFIRDCDLFRYPSSRQINTIRFSKDESPIVFSNRITYTLDGTETPVRFENEFFVSEVTNYPEREIMESRYEEFCGQRSTTRRNYFKNTAPDKFYLKYSSGQDRRRH